MYPVLFRIREFEITSFGAFLAVGVLAGLWVFRRELATRRLPVAIADAALWAVVGGLIGAKLLYVAESLGHDSLLSLLFARGGLSWYGGLIGGVGTGLLVLWYRGWPLLPALSAATPALAVGHLFGRLGCFFVGDDYGRPTALPWGVAFPEGLPPTSEPVHPTQLYEAVFLGAFALLLVRWRRAGVPDQIVVARYLIIAPLARFVIDFIRIDPALALGLTVAQWIAAGLVLIGTGLWFGTRADQPAAARAGRETRS